MKVISDKIGYLIDKDQKIIYGSKFLETKIGKNNNKIDIYSYPLNAYFTTEEKPISILFVGQSGVGKSTFINAYLNHLLGITKDDSIRYKIIFEDKIRQKDQTQSQTDTITIYKVRSPKYANRFFQLIDTPGAGDTRGDEEEKKFLGMYDKLFNEKIKNLNCVTFVIKASENRENEFQKKIIKTITSLFAGDATPNFLAILTHSDSDEDFDAVQLLEKIDVYKNKSEKGEEWFYPVTSVSYFIPFNKNANSLTKMSFQLTERAMIKYTKNILYLKNIDMNMTGQNLYLKTSQEKILKFLKEKLLIDFIQYKKNLESLAPKLNEKENELQEKNNLINSIKSEIKSENEVKKMIEENLEFEKKEKKEKEEQLEEINKKIKTLEEDIKINNNNKNEKENEIKNLQNELQTINNYIKEKSIIIQKKESSIKDKINLIENKENNIKELTKLTQNFEKDINNLKKEKDNVLNNIIEVKKQITKQFVITKIIFDEIKKISINKFNDEILDFVDDLSMDIKLINDRKYLLELFSEIKDILSKLSDKKYEEEILAKYNITKNSILNGGNN